MGKANTQWVRRTIVIPNIGELIRLWSNFSMQQFADSQHKLHLGIELLLRFPAIEDPPKKTQNELNYQRKAKTYVQKLGGRFIEKSPTKAPKCGELGITLLGKITKTLQYLRSARRACERRYGVRINQANKIPLKKPSRHASERYNKPNNHDMVRKAGVRLQTIYGQQQNLART